MTSASRLTRTDLLAYGLFGLPLAMLALPIYMLVPHLYAAELGLSLTVVGAILLAARALDAFIDPAIGLWIDRAAAARSYGSFILLSLPLLVTGYLTLFHPPAMPVHSLYAWLVLSLMLVYTGFSIATIAHNSWGASLAQLRSERSRLTATREACGLVGVLLSASLPGLTGMAGLSIGFLILLAISTCLLLKRAPHRAINTEHAVLLHWSAPLQVPLFRWLLAVFAFNGIAAAIPATLFLFFVSDHLQLPQYAGLFLVLYFIAAAAALPLWAKLATRVGEARAWLLGMLLAIVTFIWTWQLSAGAVNQFAVLCLLSGATLGADLALPSALLAGVITASGYGGRHEASFFGLWNWMTKMNLALAAGIALPLLESLGYVPGMPERSSASGLHALLLAYALLPCVLKLCAALLLWRSPLKDVS